MSVADIVARELNIEPGAVHSGTTIDSLGIDSLELVSLLQCIESEYGPIPHIAFDTVGDIEKSLRG